jgi:hypothetical protein
VLPLSSPAAPRPNFIPPSASTRLQLHRVGSARRQEVEAFISAVYRQRYGAELRHFAPMLVGLHDEHGDCVAAAGYRAANGEPLFLERYLSGAVESLLPASAGRRTPRERIVEVGHLVTARAGAGRRLILLLGPHLAAQGFDWVVSTLTQELRNLFVRMGVAPLALGAADPAVLGDEAAQWGSYYDHRPLVLAGRLDAALQMLARRNAAA